MGHVYPHFFLVVIPEHVFDDVFGSCFLKRAGQFLNGERKEGQTKKPECVILGIWYRCFKYKILLGLPTNLSRELPFYFHQFFLPYLIESPLYGGWCTGPPCCNGEIKNTNLLNVPIEFVTRMPVCTMTEICLPIVAVTSPTGDILSYQVVVHIGTPPHPYKLDLDTGSTQTWVEAEDYRSETCSALTEPSSPSTLRFHDGSVVKLRFVSDTATFTSADARHKLVADLVIGIAVPSPSSSRSLSSTDADGVLGLGPGPFSVEAADGSVLRLVRNCVSELHSQGKLSSPAFEVQTPGSRAHGSTECGTGSLTLGKEHFDPAICWVSFLPSTSPQLDRLSTRLDVVHVNSSLQFRNQVAIYDFGASYILTSIPNLRAIQETLPRSRLLRHMLIAPATQALGITFEIGASLFKFDLDILLVGRESGGESLVGIMGLPSLTKDTWILGNLFLRYFVTSFDPGQRRIGLRQGPETICT